MSRVIPKKNYAILGIVIVATVLLIYYLYMWYEVYLENKLSSPILDKYMEVINYNELDDYLIERSSAIIYISVLENSEIREFEKKFKGLIKNRKIDRDILYMDVTNDNTVASKIISKYSVDSVNNFSIPIVLVIDYGKIKSIFDIKENDYNVNSLKSFIDSVKFLDEDELGLVQLLMLGFI